MLKKKENYAGQQYLKTQPLGLMGILTVCAKNSLERRTGSAFFHFKKICFSPALAHIIDN